MTRPKQIIVFDLDGTLANGAHREHLITQRQPKQWDEYFALCEHDSPHLPITDLYESLCVTCEWIEIWTGRIEATRDVTERWIDQHLGYRPDALRMRPSADRTQDDQLKLQWLLELRAEGSDVKLVFEDRKRVVDMWRAQGVVCCQVAQGDF